MKWTLATLLGTGAVGGMGYTVHRQSELEQRNGEMERRLSEEQMWREGIQRRLDTQVTLDDMDDAVEMVTPATVRVEGARWLGSGMIFTDRLGRIAVLTNSHVTEDNEFRNANGDPEYWVQMYTGNDFKDPKRFKVRPATRKDGSRSFSPSDKHDLALLRFSEEDEREILTGGIPIPKIQICNRVQNPLRAGDRVIVVGNPFGERDHVTDGIVSNSDAFGDIEPENVFVRTSAPINGGNSGGGGFRVRREAGKLIVEYIGTPTWGYRGGDGVSGMTDGRVTVLRCHEWGFPIVSDEEFAAYQWWWKEVIEPFQKARGIGGGSVGTMPPADD